MPPLVDTKHTAWRNPTIPTIPREHVRRLKEPTTAMINNVDFDMNTFKNNVNAGFRAMSNIQKALYIDEPATVTLHTKERVELQVALWKSRNHKAILVEVRHVRGNPIIFHKYAHCVLDVAQTNGTLSATKQQEIVRKFQDPQDDAELHSNLESIVGLLSHNRPLAMQSLLTLTNPVETNLHVSVQVCRVVLFGDLALPGPTIKTQSDQNPLSEIRNVVLNESLNEDNHVTFQVLANALDVVANPGLQDLYDGNRQDKYHLVSDLTWTDLAASNIWLKCLLDFLSMSAVLALSEVHKTPNLYNKISLLAYENSLQAYQTLRPLTPGFFLDSDCPTDELFLSGGFGRQTAHEILIEIPILEGIISEVRREETKYRLLELKDKLRDEFFRLTM